MNLAIYPAAGPNLRFIRSVSENLWRSWGDNNDRSTLAGGVPVAAIVADQIPF